MATVGDLLIAATDQLTTANIITARLDATVLIADLLDQDRAAVSRRARRCEERAHQ